MCTAYRSTAAPRHRGTEAHPGWHAYSVPHPHARLPGGDVRPRARTAAQPRGLPVRRTAAWTRCCFPLGYLVMTPFGSAPGRPLCLLSARLAAPGSPAVPGQRPGSGDPSHCLGCPSEPPPRPPIWPPLTIKAPGGSTAACTGLCRLTELVSYNQVVVVVVVAGSTTYLGPCHLLLAACCLLLATGDSH